MRESIKALLIVLAAIVSLVAVQTVWADECTVAGEIVAADRSISVIVVMPDDGVDGDQVTIIGFPFHKLEMQLDEVLYPLDTDADGITIGKGDCVEVVYSIKKLDSGDIVNKFEFLTEYCEGCYYDSDYYEGGALTNDAAQKQPNKPSKEKKPKKPKK